MADIFTITNTLGSFATNCYTVVNSSSREAVIIDPADRGDFLINMCKEQKIKPVAVFLTHGHIDHIGALFEIREFYPDIKVYAGAAEEKVLKDSRLNLSAMFGGPVEEKADIYVEDGKVIDILGTSVKCINVPGHTIGGTCYYFEAEKLLFSGDTLFAGSVGRSDFPTGDENALLDAIEKKLFVLPEDVTVYPGHNQRTTIKREKAGNPFF